MVDNARSSSRSRKNDILDAARREFATAGFAGARIERIAASAAVNKQLLFHYFESKEGLFTAALAQLLAQLETGRGASESPVAEVRQLLRDLVTQVRAVPGVVGIVADARSNPEFPPEAAALLRAWRARLVDRLIAALQAGQQRGYFRDDVDPAGVAAIAVAAALGAVTVDPAAAETSYEDALANLMVDHCAWR